MGAFRSRCLHRNEGHGNDIGMTSCGVRVSGTTCPPNARQVYYCQHCEFEVMQKNNKTTYILDWAFLVAEIILGLVLLGIELHYDLGVEIFGRYYVNHPNERFVRSMLLRNRLIHCITPAFPLIFVPIILVTKAVMRRDTVIAIMCIFFGLTGFGCYLACGIVSLATKNLKGNSKTATITYGTIAVIIAVVYLAHGIFEIVRNAAYIRLRFTSCWYSFRKPRSE